MESITNYEVKNYLEKVKKEIKEKKVQDALLSELYYHLEDSASYQIESGMTEEEAWHYALKTMGDASEIGRELNRIHQKRNPALLLIIVGLSCFIAVLGNIRQTKIYGNSVGIQQFFYPICEFLFILFFIYGGTFVFQYKKFVVKLFWGVWGILGIAWGINYFFDWISVDTILLVPFQILLGFSYNVIHTVLFSVLLLTILPLAYYEWKPQKNYFYQGFFLFLLVVFLNK